MATFDLSAIEALGASGSALVVLGYGLARVVTGIVDRVVFLIGLHMILRTTSGKTRQTALLAYVERGRARPRPPDRLTERGSPPGPTP